MEIHSIKIHKDALTICPNGRWMEWCDARDYLNLNDVQMKFIKNNGTKTNIVFERQVHAPYPYNKFKYAFISPEETNAHKDMSIYLITWCKLCQFLESLLPNAMSDIVSELFLRYTGLPMTKQNIEHAISSRVIISRTTLEEKLE